MRRLMLAALLFLIACGGERPAAEWGEELFRDSQGLSPSEFNSFSCATCHLATAEPAAGDDTIRPGYSLAGSTRRERGWGGAELRLEDSIDACLVYFMRGVPLDLESHEARALYEYLDSISPEGSSTDTLPFTVVENIEQIATGDAQAGAEIFRRACQPCHGEAHTGRGSILRKKVILPEVTDDYDMLFPGTPKGLVVIELIRHGRFFEVGSTMPLFSVEVLSDAQIGDLLAFLGTPAE